MRKIFINRLCIVIIVCVTIIGYTAGCNEKIAFQNFSVKTLGAVAGKWSWAFAVNNEGVVVGAAKFNHVYGTQAFMWMNNKLYRLGTLNTIQWSVSGAEGINNKNMIVGQADTNQFNKEGLFSHAFLWKNGKMTDLGTLGGNDSDAHSISDSGWIVGTSDIGTNDKRGYPVQHAFLWKNGKMTDLGTLGGVSSKANDINDTGQVVGESTNKKGYPCAFVWDYKHGMRNLNLQFHSNKMWFLESAFGINSKGWIVGVGYKGRVANVFAFLLKL